MKCRQVVTKDKKRCGKPAKKYREGQILCPEHYEAQEQFKKEYYEHFRSTCKNYEKGCVCGACKKVYERK